MSNVSLFGDALLLAGGLSAAANAINYHQEKERLIEDAARELPDDYVGSMVGSATHFTAFESLPTYRKVLTLIGGGFGRNLAHKRFLSRKYDLDIAKKRVERLNDAARQQSIFGWAYEMTRQNEEREHEIYSRITEREIAAAEDAVWEDII